MVVVVVELEVAGTVTTAGGAVSTTGAGSVESTVLWYEKQPVTIPQAAMAAGMIAKRLIDRIEMSSIRLRTVENSKKPATLDL